MAFAEVADMVFIAVFIELFAELEIFKLTQINSSVILTLAVRHLLLL
jgi:hypothetical protein